MFYWILVYSKKVIYVFIQASYSGRFCFFLDIYDCPLYFGPLLFATYDNLQLSNMQLAGDYDVSLRGEFSHQYSSLLLLLGKSVITKDFTKVL